MRADGPTKLRAVEPEYPSAQPSHNNTIDLRELGKRNAKRTFVLWLALIAMFLGIWRVFEPDPGSRARSPVTASDSASNTPV